MTTVHKVCALLQAYIQPILRIQRPTPARHQTHAPCVVTAQRAHRQPHTACGTLPSCIVTMKRAAGLASPLRTVLGSRAMLPVSRSVACHAAAMSSCSGGPPVEALPADAIFPSARLLLLEKNASAGPLMNRGSGKGGRITKGDVLALLGAAPRAATAAAASSCEIAAMTSGRANTSFTEPQTTALPSAPTPTAASAPAPASASPASATTASFDTGAPRGAYTDTKPSQVRRVISQRLTESKARVPHQYFTMDCQIDALLKHRAALKAQGVVVSVNDMVVKAAALALRDVPEANCTFDVASGTVRANSGIDISVAVATDGGLITPIVRAADKLGLAAINARTKDLATRARTGKLKPDEFQGGSFTISNLGMFGIDEFTAVINPPQATIMAVGQGRPMVVGAPLTAAELDSWPPAPSADAAAPLPASVATVMTVQISADVRVLDAGLAGSFLQVFRHYVQNPALFSV